MWLVLRSDGEGLGMGKCMLTVSCWREVGGCDEKWGNWKLGLFGEKGKERNGRKLSGSGRASEDQLKLHVCCVTWF